GVMSDSGEQNYGERVRGGVEGGGCVVPSFLYLFRPVGLKAEGGKIKNGRCVPSVMGEGSSISFRRCSPAKPRRSHLGLAGWARCQRHKMAEEPRVDAGPRLTVPQVEFREGWVGYIAGIRQFSGLNGMMSRSRRSSRRHYTRSRSRSRSHRRSRSRSYSRDYRRRHSHSHSPMSTRRRHVGNRANPDPNCCLGVFGLSLYTTERDLREVFSKYGPIADVSIVYDQQSRRSRGFAFVYFENVDDAKEAKERANGMELDGRRIRVDFSITKRPHTPTPGIYMGRPT
ncbi:Transformer-2 protein-beta, partial [Galemys pyrenaicus]